jgi:uncharacterized membrane protein YedE/YeeE
VGRSVKALSTALLAGVIFGVGLCVSGMTDPKNILAFLDVTGRWSPNLAGVMLGAVAVHATWLRLGARVTATGLTSLLAPQSRIDGALLGGAALFGVGWGLSGYCPGPALVALGGGALGTIVFVAAMVVGIGVSEAAKRRPGSITAAHRSGAPANPTP